MLATTPSRTMTRRLQSDIVATTKTEIQRKEEVMFVSDFFLRCCIFFVHKHTSVLHFTSILSVCAT